MFSYKYPHPAVTTDCVIFGFDGTRLQVLLIERGLEPYKGKWAFPGGFMKMDESAEQGAKRELMEETGMKAEYMEQFHAFTDPDRDPRERVDSNSGLKTTTMSHTGAWATAQPCAAVRQDGWHAQKRSA